MQYKVYLRLIVQSNIHAALLLATAVGVNFLELLQTQAVR
jgi:hypothetical protein